MARNGARRMHIAQCEFTPWHGRAIAPSPPGAIASMNTHDMPSFAAFWCGDDVDTRVELGLIDDAAAADERRARRELTDALCRVLRIDRASPPPVPGLDGDAEQRAMRAALDGCVAELAAGDAWLVLVSLEDLWLERAPQNVPGTSTERPNWRRKMRHSMEQLADLPHVARTLAAVDRLRRTRP
jgi:4-alpha-glucanotransferase